MDNIKLLKTGKKNEMLAALKEMQRNLPEIMEHISIIAQIRKANYDALIKQGFTSEQALELCKTITL